MVTPKIGPTEAAVLNALTRPSTVAEITDRLTDQRLDDPAVYIALRRMLNRNFVTRESVTVTAADRKQRTVGRYRITGQGSEALDAHKLEVSRLLHPRALGAPA